MKTAHPVGTQARLALALGLYTGLRRGDLRREDRPATRSQWCPRREAKEKTGRGACHPHAHRSASDHRRHVERQLGVSGLVVRHTVQRCFVRRLVPQALR